MGKTRYVFEPVGLDLFAPHAGTPESGTVVVKTQPFGCPKNGTMGFCYVEDAETGAFYGLVLLNSLEKVDVNTLMIKHARSHQGVLTKRELEKKFGIAIEMEIGEEEK